MKNKGISLIAIVIIVVILIFILAIGAVLIINGGKTEQNKIAESSNNYSSNVSEKSNIEIKTKANINDLKIGDYILYYPDSKEYTTSGNENNGSKQTFKTVDAKWIYIGKDENGKNLITTKEPVFYGDENDLKLDGAGGYLEGEKELNSICKALYSNNIGNARSMNFDDTIRLLNYTGPKGCYAENGKGETLTEEAMKIKDIEKKVGKTIDRRKTPDGKTDISEYLSDCVEIPTTSDKIKETYSDYVYNSNKFWLSNASTKAELPGSFSGGSVMFLMRTVDREKIGGTTLFISYDKPQSVKMHAAIRPVVEINSSATVGKNNNGEWILK